VQGLAALSQALYSELVAGATGIVAGVPGGCVPVRHYRQPGERELHDAGDEDPDESPKARGRRTGLLAWCAPLPQR
jgi:hypothetical protein